MSMPISQVDWAIVVGYFVLCTVIGLYFTRRGGESLYRRVRPGGPGWAQVSQPLGFGRCC